jgi:uncharacterized zinc-type alcohol dehydrogenase-like protein
MKKITVWAADGPKQTIQAVQTDVETLKADEVEVKVDFCGLCHSDYSMWANEWGFTAYPFVGGHEVVGTISARGELVKHLEVGQKVGVGWVSRSDLNSPQSLAGDHNLSANNEMTIVGRFGGFADTVRCQSVWAIPLPESLDIQSAGPLFCGGITVFNPMVQFNLKPTDKVAVIGIGGLGHLAIQFLNKWGCEVTAFTSSQDKADEARQFGAHHTVSSRDSKAWKKLNGKFDFVISTVAVDMDWKALAATLAPKGRLHFVGIVPSELGLRVSDLMSQQRSISGSPVGAPQVIATMLEFCARHQIKPQIEVFPMTEINEAMEHLEAGKARYRIILENN